MRPCLFEKSFDLPVAGGFREVDAAGVEAFAVVVGVEHPASVLNYGKSEDHLIQSRDEDETSVEDGLNIGVR